MSNPVEQFGNAYWRVSNLYSIVDKSAQRVRFKENGIQKALNARKEQRRIVLKARQFGVSTNELIRMLDYALWTKNTTCCILAHEQDAIEKLFRVVRRAYDFLHPSLRPELDRGGGSKYELFFPRMNSRIYCDLESRGDTIHWLHISEAAFIPDPDRMKATMQAVPLHGKITIESTPNGMGNHFYDMWMDPLSPYAKLFFPWFLMPEYSVDAPVQELSEDEEALVDMALEKYGVEMTKGQIAFRRLKQAELKHLFIQEYPEDDQSCFLASGNAAMDLKVVKEMLDAAPKPIEKDEMLQIYESPYSSGLYVIGADAAEGVGTDYSVGSVIDARTLRVVATVRGHMKPSAFAKRLVALGKKYTVRSVAPVIAVERNNHGHAVILELDEHCQYPALYVGKDDRLGWLTDRVSRPIMIDTFIDAVEHQHLRILDAETLRECLTLVDNSGKIEAAPGKHDDCVMATAIALQLALEHSKASSLYQDIGAKILT